MSKVTKRIKIGLNQYERVIRQNLDGAYLYYKRIAGKKRGTFCYAYFQSESEDGGPVALWESTGHGWVWRTWKYSPIYKRIFNKV